MYFNKLSFFFILVSKLEKEDIDKMDQSRNPTEYQTIFKVINIELPTILPDNISLKVYIEEFLARNKGSIPRLLAGSNALVQLNPEYKQEAANMLMNSIKDEFSNMRTLKVSSRSILNTFFYLFFNLINIYLFYIVLHINIRTT